MERQLRIAEKQMQRGGDGHGRREVWSEHPARRAQQRRSQTGRASSSRSESRAPGEACDRSAPSNPPAGFVAHGASSRSVDMRSPRSVLQRRYAKGIHVQYVDLDDKDAAAKVPEVDAEEEDRLGVSEAHEQPDVETADEPSIKDI